MNSYLLYSPNSKMSCSIREVTFNFVFSCLLDTR